MKLMNIVSYKQTWPSKKQGKKGNSLIDIDINGIFWFGVEESTLWGEKAKKAIFQNAFHNLFHLPYSDLNVPATDLNLKSEF